jgi:hypothetical protein
MGKYAKHSETEINNDDQFYGVSESYSFDEKAFSERYEKRKARSQRSKIAHRRIEQYLEENELEKNLDEYYYHVDD